MQSDGMEHAAPIAPAGGPPCTQAPVPVSQLSPGPQSASLWHAGRQDSVPVTSARQRYPLRQPVESWHASRQTFVPPALLQLLPAGHATLLDPPQVSEQYPPGTPVAQKAGAWPQSVSAAQAVPTREAPQSPVATLQFELPQSASAVHLGRQRFERQTCSALQSEAP